MCSQGHRVARCRVIIIAAQCLWGRHGRVLGLGWPLLLPLPARHQEQATLGRRHGPSALEQQQ